jgi:hypothetical protein
VNDVIGMQSSALARPSNSLILSEAPSGAQSKDLSNSPIVACSRELFERSFDSGFACAQDQG